MRAAHKPLAIQAGFLLWKGARHSHNGGDHETLDSLWGTITSGLVLTLILFWIVKLGLGS